MTGPCGFWCRWCGRYQSIRSRKQVRAASKHATECHQKLHGDTCQCDLKGA